MKEIKVRDGVLDLTAGVPQGPPSIGQRWRWTKAAFHVANDAYRERAISRRDWFRLARMTLFYTWNPFAIWYNYPLKENEKR